jgi:hypothetical protein
MTASRIIAPPRRGRVALAVKCSHVLEEAAVPIVGTMKPLNGVGYARWRAARGDFQGTLTAGNGAVGRGANECGLIAAATSAIATSAMILRNANLQIEYRSNSTPPERNMIAQRGVGISCGRLFKCRRLSGRKSPATRRHRRRGFLGSGHSSLPPPSSSNPRQRRRASTRRSRTASSS